jgi:hypothetical protein
MDLCSLVDHFNIYIGSYRSTLFEIYLAEIDKQFDEAASTDRYYQQSSTISYVKFPSIWTSSHRLIFSASVSEDVVAGEME